MEKQFYRLRKNLLPALRVFYRPALLISLGLHGLILMSPISQEPKSTKPVKLEKVKITNLLASSSKPSGQPASKPSVAATKPTPTTVASIPRLIVASSPPRANAIPKVISTPPATPAASATPKPTPTTTTTPEPTPTATPTPKPTPTATTTPEPTATPTPTPTPTPTATQNPTSDAGDGELQGFLGQIGDLASKPSPDLFADPSLFFDQLSPPKLKPDILSTTWIDGKNPVQVSVSILNNPANSSSFGNEQLGSYGGGEVYKVTQGSQVWYFNFVPTKDSKGTIVVVWKHDVSRIVPAQ